MKKNIETISYIFEGSYIDDAAIGIDQYGHSVGELSQRTIIKSIRNQIDNVSGTKISDISNAQVYHFYVGDRKDPDKLIKVRVPSSSLKKGDPNIKELNELARYSVKVKVVNALKYAGAGIAIAVGMTLAAYAVVKTDEAETKDREKATNSFIDENNASRVENEGIDTIVEEALGRNR